MIDLPTSGNNKLDADYFDNNRRAENGIPCEILHDLASRFLINIPAHEKKDMVRICFQVELAHWYYIDFCRQDDPNLPAVGIKGFVQTIFKEYPFLNSGDESIETIYEKWKQYKYRVPVFGAIILNETMEKVLLVRGYHSRISWGFPKGKVNKDETGVQCAIREVKEETDFDISPLINEKEFIENTIHDHQIRLYIIPGVPSSFNFKPNTRKEVKEIQWFNIADLPTHKKDNLPKEKLGLQANNFFMVNTFNRPLRKWINNRHTQLEKERLKLEQQRERDMRVRDTDSKRRKDADITKQLEDINKRLLQKEQEKFQRLHSMHHPLLSSSTGSFNEDKQHNYCNYLTPPSAFSNPLIASPQLSPPSVYHSYESLRNSMEGQRNTPPKSNGDYLKRLLGVKTGPKSPISPYNTSNDAISDVLTTPTFSNDTFSYTISSTQSSTDTASKKTGRGRGIIADSLQGNAHGNTKNIVSQQPDIMRKLMAGTIGPRAVALQNERLAKKQENRNKQQKSSVKRNDVLGSPSRPQHSIVQESRNVLSQAESKRGTYSNSTDFEGPAIWSNFKFDTGAIMSALDKELNKVGIRKKQ